MADSRYCMKNCHSTKILVADGFRLYKNKCHCLQMESARHVHSYPFRRWHRAGRDEDECHSN